MMDTHTSAHKGKEGGSTVANQQLGSAPISAAAIERSSGYSAAQNTAALRLLRFESDLRKVRSLEAWGLFVANETRQVTQSLQTFVFNSDRDGGLITVAASALSSIDRSAPLVLSMKSIVGDLTRRGVHQTIQEFDVGSIKVAPGVAQTAYPLCFMLWLPFINLGGRVIGGMLQANTRPWLETEVVLSRHVVEACGYALVAVGASKADWRTSGIGNSRRYIGAAALAFIGAGALPVSMTALAPVEVVPRNPFFISAPIEGVVEKVLVDPNQAVKKGQPLVQFADTVLRNRYEISERETLIAEAKVKKSTQLAFVDVRGRHDLGIAQSELELRRAERDYARDLLERSIVRSERDGVAIFSDPRDLLGKPVAIGERLMEVADPLQFEFRVDLPVSEAIVLREGARVKVFLDSDPLNWLEARLKRADFQAKIRDNQVLAFKLIAELSDPKQVKVRLGVRGTAQVYSDQVSLMLYLFRRPYSALRQWLGV